jgi:D-3-phosphoglycerate dehydrogenase
MSEPVVDALILDLLEWLLAGERGYDEVLDAWRTSCPRLPVWEEANSRGLVSSQEDGGRVLVRVTAAGLAFRNERRRRPT